VKAHPTTPITLYRHPLSGHSHRVELFLRLLDLPVTLIDVDLGNGEQKEPAFLAMNRCAGVDRTDRGVAGIRADGEGGGWVASGRVGAGGSSFDDETARLLGSCAPQPSRENRRFAIDLVQPVVETLSACSYVGRTFSYGRYARPKRSEVRGFSFISDHPNS